MNLPMKLTSHNYRSFVITFLGLCSTLPSFAKPGTTEIKINKEVIEIKLTGSDAAEFFNLLDGTSERFSEGLEGPGKKYYPGVLSQTHHVFMSQKPLMMFSATINEHKDATDDQKSAFIAMFCKKPLPQKLASECSIAFSKSLVYTTSGSDFLFEVDTRFRYTLQKDSDNDPGHEMRVRYENFFTALKKNLDGRSQSKLSLFKTAWKDSKENPVPNEEVSFVSKDKRFNFNCDYNPVGLYDQVSRSGLFDCKLEYFKQPKASIALALYGDSSLYVGFPENQKLIARFNSLESKRLIDTFVQSSIFKPGQKTQRIQIGAKPGEYLTCTTDNSKSSCKLRLPLFKALKPSNKVPLFTFESPAELKDFRTLDRSFSVACPKQKKHCELQFYPMNKF